MVAFALITACKKIKFPEDIPVCIEKTIKANKNNADWATGSVEEYEFQGKLVYAFNPYNRRIADASTFIYTADCKTLCSVGGFGGPSVNLCNAENFFQKAILKRTIWKK